MTCSPLGRGSPRRRARTGSAAGARVAARAALIPRSEAVAARVAGAGGRLGGGGRRGLERRRADAREDSASAASAGGSGAGPDGGATARWATCRARRRFRARPRRGATRPGPSPARSIGCSARAISLTTSVLFASDATSRWPARSGIPAPVSEPRTTTAARLHHHLEARRGRPTSARRTRCPSPRSRTGRPRRSSSAPGRCDDRERRPPAIEADGRALARARPDARDAVRADGDGRAVGEARGRGCRCRRLEAVVVGGVGCRTARS